MKEISFALEWSQHIFVPSLHPDLQKDLLSMLFPETDHENEIYRPGRQDSTHTISRRMSM